MPAAIVGAGEGGGREAGLVGGDPELFLELANKRALGPLARLDLAARKLPQACHGAARQPLLEEHPALAVDQRRRDHDHCRIFFQIRGPC